MNNTHFFYLLICPILFFQDHPVNLHIQQKLINIAFELNNRNLEQEIQELSRYDRIIAVATELGLELNEANIKNVSR